MNERRFVNQFQPQTLVIGTMLCYIDAFFGFLFGMVSTSVVLALLTIAGLAIGGFGIANEKKWGYAVAVGAAVLQVVMLLAVAGSDVLELPADPQPHLRRRPRRAAAAPAEPRLPAHLVQVATVHRVTPGPPGESRLRRTGIDRGGCSGARVVGLVRGL